MPFVLSQEGALLMIATTCWISKLCEGLQGMSPEEINDFMQQQASAAG